VSAAARPEASIVHHEAERATIAGLIRNGDGDAIARLGITPDLFAMEATREAFQAIAKAWRDGATPDAATLRDALKPATYIELETTLAENVSGANLSYHLGILKDYRQRRADATARDELAQAVAAGAPPHKLIALAENVRAAVTTTEDPTQPPRFKPMTEDDLNAARLHPTCIVENHLYVDLGVINAAGGTGKTTLQLYEAIHIAIGRDLWGHRVLKPGKTLFITAEDGAEILKARLKRLMEALNLGAYEQRIVRESICIWDVTGTLIRLAEMDKHGNLQLTDLADRIVDTYRDAGLVQIIIDPVISFSPGERIINDGEQAIVTACRRIIRGLQCAVRLVHHTGKANARAGAIDQYAGRGGTALPDGARMVTTMVNAGDVNQRRPDGFEIGPDDAGILMSRPKISYASPQPNIWIRRRGWTFEWAIETRETAEARTAADATAVAAFLADELIHGRRYTANTLELSGKTKLPRARLRAALATLETSGRLEERALPAEERHGKRKTYLHHRQPATAFGGLAADKAPDEPGATPNPPPGINPPPYREKGNGGLDAVPFSSTSTNPPADNGGLAADWRINQDEAIILPTLAPEPGIADDARAAPAAGPAPTKRPRTGPLDKRILDAIRACAGGMAKDDLIRLVANGKGASPAMIDAALSKMLLDGRIGRVNGHLVVGQS
jgi:RecA-family ATPase